MKKIFFILISIGSIHTAQAQIEKKDSLSVEIKFGQEQNSTSIIPGKYYRINQLKGQDVCIQILKVDQQTIYGQGTTFDAKKIGRHYKSWESNIPNTILLSNIRKITIHNTIPSNSFILGYSYTLELVDGTNATVKVTWVNQENIYGKVMLKGYIRMDSLPLNMVRKIVGERWGGGYASTVNGMTTGERVALSVILGIAAILVRFIPF